MKKLAFIVLLMVCSVCLASGAKLKLYKDFPVYPPHIIEQYKKSKTVHIKVPLGAYGYVEDAQFYIVYNAKRLGWIQLEETKSDPLTYIFAKGSDPCNVVKVILNRQMDIDGVKGDETYFDSSQGSVEYIFTVKDLLPQYHILKVVTETRQKAVDAYIALLKKESFEDVAKRFSDEEKIEELVTVEAKSDSKMLKELMRLMPGQMTDVYQDKDLKFYIIKLVKVLKNKEEFMHRGQNTEDRRPSSAAMTYTGKDSSLAEVMVDAVSTRAKNKKNSN